MIKKILFFVVLAASISLCKMQAMEKGDSESFEVFVGLRKLFNGDAQEMGEDQLESTRPSPVPLPQELDHEPRHGWSNSRQSPANLPQRFFWLEPLEHYKTRGGMPRPTDLSIVSQLSPHKVGLLVTLLPDRLPFEFTQCPVASLHIPVAFLGVPTLENFDLLLANVYEIHRRGKAVIFHGEDGDGRTGSILAAILVAARGFSADAAMDLVCRSREQYIPDAPRSRAPEMFFSAEQIKFVHIIEATRRGAILEESSLAPVSDFPALPSTLRLRKE